MIEAAYLPPSLLQWVQATMDDNRPVSPSEDDFFKRFETDNAGKTELHRVLACILTDYLFGCPTLRAVQITSRKKDNISEGVQPGQRGWARNRARLYRFDHEMNPHGFGTFSQLGSFHMLNIAYMHRLGHTAIDGLLKKGIVKW